MRVLLCLRGDCYKNYSTDTKQSQMLYRYCKEKNIDVEVCNGGLQDFSKYDVVHLFDLNCTGEMYKYFKEASRSKCNIVITPMYWNYEKYFRNNQKIESIKLWKRCNPYRSEMLKKSRAIVCSSDIELELLRKEFGEVEGEIVHYGSEIEYDEIPLYSFKGRYDLDRFVLSVGRIGPVKNQLALARVTKKLGIPLVLIGNIQNKKYFSECIKHEHVKYFGFMDTYNIYNAYRFAEVHAAPGFYEMPGIASLEAANSGCKVLTSTEGCAKEYLKDMAYYCNPFKDEDIEDNLIKAMEGKKSAKLKKHVQQRYKWEKFCEGILKIYEEVY